MRSGLNSASLYGDLVGGEADSASIARKATKPKTQDGRALRRYRRRWKVKRFLAGLLSHRRGTVRWGRYAENDLGFVHLACLLMLLKPLLR